MNWELVFFSFKEVKKTVEKGGSEGLSKCMRETCFSQWSVFFFAW